MEHFYQNIDGWFSYELIYKEMVARASEGALFVEVGSFKGRSSSFLAVEIANSGKNIKLDCIDTWQGSIEHQKGEECEIKEVVEGTLYETFLKNTEPVKHLINPIREPSYEAAARYADGSIDFIMIDGDHTFDGVCKDIQAFLPKMKKGGVMTGDDCWEGTDPRKAFEHMLPGRVKFNGIHAIYIIE